MHGIISFILSIKSLEILLSEPDVSGFSPAGVAVSGGGRALWPLQSSPATLWCRSAAAQTRSHISTRWKHFHTNASLQQIIHKNQSEHNLQRKSWGVVQSWSWGVSQVPLKTLMDLKTKLANDSSLYNKTLPFFSRIKVKPVNFWFYFGCFQTLSSDCSQEAFSRLWRISAPSMSGFTDCLTSSITSVRIWRRPATHKQPRYEGRKQEVRF